MPKSNALLATAYHEAGHAIVARELGVAVRRVTIEPSGDAAGSVEGASVMGRYRPDVDHRSTQVRLRIERSIMVRLAGPIAQRKYNPRSWRSHHGKDDYQVAADLILYRASPGEHADACMRLLEIETGHIVDRNWDLIDALAHELIRRRTMTGRELGRFIRDWHTDRQRKLLEQRGRIRVTEVEAGEPEPGGVWI